jgi:glycosyltransferase involved in cell wall biosynthesis
MESHIQTLARAQVALGLDVQVVCVNHADRCGREIVWHRYGANSTHIEMDNGVRVMRVARSASVARLDLCPSLPRLLHQIDAEGVDLFHLHTPNPTMLLALCILRPATPIVITHHSDIIRQKLLKFALRPFELFVYHRAACINATSPRYPAASDVLPRFREKVTSLPMGIDLGAFLRPTAKAMRHAQELRAQHGSPLWLCVGRCVYYKNFRTAIHALAHVPGKLLIIGHGPQEAMLRHLAEQLGVANRVIWQSYATPDELVGAYHAATALWFPSNARSEAFGLVQVEAMASSCPVINTEIPGSGVSWVSPHEVSGLTAPCNDADAFAKAAWRLLSEPGLRDRLAQAARQRAMEQFDQSVMARRSLAIYERAIAHGRVSTRSIVEWAQPQYDSQKPALISADELDEQTVAV